MINYLHKLFPSRTRVLILGFGREGKSSLLFLKKHIPGIMLSIADANEGLKAESLPKDCLHLGPHYLDAIRNYDWVIKSPGVKLPEMSERQLSKITSQTDLFLQIYGRQTIGVTGTKGKSTTASLIYHLLKQSGKKALLMGNIGLPAFDFIEKIDFDTQVVYELSAHQLQYVNHSPHVGILLNIFPEHLDFFGNIDVYQTAKANIFRFQKPDDVAICGPSIQRFRCNHFTNLQQEMHLIFGDQVTGKKLLQITGLKGDHNLINILLAAKAVLATGMKKDEIVADMTGFHALPHRLEEVGVYGGIRFVNDSIATIPQATIAAVLSLGKVDALILGGFDRGIDYLGLVDFLSKSSVSYMFFLGKAGKRMLKQFTGKNTGQHLIVVNNLEEIFEYMKDKTDIHSCLLSPAAASYDQFHNFEHRGDRFKELAQEMEIAKA